MYGDLLVGDHGRRSAATVRRVHATVRSALNTAVKRRLIPWNPALHVELPAAQRTPTIVWTGEQMAHFLDSNVDGRLYALWHVIALIGLRRGEALGLR
jgi:integrase